MEGIGVFASVLPGKNAAICHDRLRKVLVHEVVTEVNAMAHPLVRDTAGKLLVETKFKVKLGIKRPVRLVHQPGAPVRILFANHLHFGTPTPTKSFSTSSSWGCFSPLGALPKYFWLASTAWSRL